MSAGLDARPSAVTYDLEDLLQLAWEGNVRVPHFQRDFRWGREDVLRLFDSIVKGYPIGSLLFWIRPAVADEVRLGALRIAAPATDGALWVVDGQQRITSLANALHESGARDPRFALAYDLQSEEFVPRTGDGDASIVPLPVLYDLQALIKWFADYPEVGGYLGRATSVAKTLRQFKIPAYRVERGDEAVLRDIFDRMNNYGKRLSRAEIFTALYAETEPHQHNGATISAITQGIDAELGFGQLDPDTVLRAILARRGPDVTREIRNEFNYTDRRRSVEFPGEPQEGAFRAGGEALRRAVVFLQNEVGVPHFAFLPYRYLLVVLARLFAHHPEPDVRNARLIVRWYWRAAVTGLDFLSGGSSTQAMRLLCSRILPGDLSASVQGLLDAIGEDARPLPSLETFRTNTATTKITLCAWWGQQPRSPVSGARYERTQLAETLADNSTAADAVRYITNPRTAEPAHRGWAANRVLIPGPDEPEVEIDALFTQQYPAMDELTWLAVLDSHTLDPALVGLLASGDVGSFLTARQEALYARLRQFLATRCEWGFENTPPLEDLIIEDLADEEPDGAP